ncbi:MAG TPA: hypothetical protein VFY79_12135 [Dehalococcoidia bacterium]|jgi:hypothetical protein|nr:hypothetical protein [Dehalococcoidia bacterium]
MESTTAGNEGIRHAHVWEEVTVRSALQTAHDRLRWDVSASRVLSINACTICGELDRASVVECAVTGCMAHRICERPYH